jgi:hypothetical protein
MIGILRSKYCDMVSMLRRRRRWESDRDSSGVLSVGIEFSGLVLGVIAGKEFVDIAASFVGRVCSSAKSLRHVFKCQRLYVEFPIQLLTHIALHLADIPQIEHFLHAHTPRRIRGV